MIDTAGHGNARAKTRFDEVGVLMQPTRAAGLAVALLGATAVATSACAATPIEKLAWLGGCWVAEAGEPGSGEHWMPLAGGTLLGMARTVKRGRTVDYEFLHIGAGDDGQIVLTAQPAGRQAVRFAVQRLADDEAVFENPAHDFPTRIIYKRLAGARLVARIEGQRDAATRAFDFPMRRASCDALLGTPRQNPPDRSISTGSSTSP